tara:strand:- start:421 stop:741 length:321 start_codon:yes stop_codon:yes gene_type:complete
MSRYNDAAILKSPVQGQNNIQYEYVQNVKYPDIPLSFDDIYVYTTQGDRLDILAQQYYNDSTLWWIISISNPQLSQNSYFVPEGTQLRIPSDVAGIKNAMNEFNQF